MLGSGVCWWGWGGATKHVVHRVLDLAVAYFEDEEAAFTTDRDTDEDPQKFIIDACGRGRSCTQ